MNANQSKPVIVFMSRIRSRNSSEYRWSYGFSREIEIYSNDSNRYSLSVIFIISNDLNASNQLFCLLNEVSQLKSKLKLSELSVREKEILQWIAKGKTDHAIAKLLFISEKTAKKHHNNILKKLNMHKTAELVALAVECGM